MSDTGGSTWLDQQISASASTSSAVSPKSIEEELRAMGYGPAQLPDYTAYINATKSAIEKKRQAILGMGGPGVRRQASKADLAALETEKAGVERRRQEAASATETAFQRAIGDIEKRRAEIDPAVAAAATQALFDKAAAETAARNAAVTAQIASDQQAVVGAGPVSGEAAATTGALTQAGAVSGAAAQNIAEIGRQELALLGASAGTASAARLGEYSSLAQAAKEEAQARFIEAERQRIQREEAAARSAAARRQAALTDLAGAEDELLAKIELTKAEDAVKASNAWRDKVMGYEAERIMSGETATGAASSDISYRVFTSASKDYGGGKDKFKETFNDLRSKLGPDFDNWLVANNLPKNVDEAWKAIDKKQKASETTIKDTQRATDSKAFSSEISSYQRSGGSLAALAYQGKLKFDRVDKAGWAFFKDKYGNTYTERVQK
jgi:hypothetical protein